MDLLLLKERIRNFGPLVGLIFACYYAYDYYFVFTTEATSPLMVKQGELKSIEEQNRELDKKVKDLEEFAKRLDSMKSEISSLAQKLAETKDAISDEVQMPTFMKLVVSEAKRVGLNVLSIVPAKKEQKEYYYEYPVEVKFRGLFAQVYSFMSRVSNLQRIVRIEKFDMKPMTNSSDRFVELEGTLELKTYSYIGSKADSVGKASK